jgi:archaellum component FlaC
METVTLVFDERTFEVNQLSLRQNCDAPALMGVSSYRVKSSAPASIFQLFIAALNGTDIKITNENVLYLSQLSCEFGFSALSARISDFDNSPEQQIGLLKSTISKQANQIVELETAIKGLTCHIGGFDSLIQGVKSKVTELSSQFTKMNTKISKMGGQVREVHTRVSEIERKTDQVHTKVAQVDNHTNQLRSDISMLTVLKEPQLIDSLIISRLPPLFDEFRAKRCNLLWRGSRDGFTANEFHRRCDGRANTLTLILDTDGNVFGGFMPVKWESTAPGESYGHYKGDDSLRSFLFTLRNPHGVPSRKFALKADEKHQAIFCASNEGPHFGSNDMFVNANCNTNRNSFTQLAGCVCKYESDTAFEHFFTGAQEFTVKEIEVFEIAD